MPLAAVQVTTPLLAPAEALTLPGAEGRAHEGGLSFRCEPGAAPPADLELAPAALAGLSSTKATGSAAASAGRAHRRPRPPARCRRKSDGPVRLGDR